MHFPREIPVDLRVVISHQQHPLEIHITRDEKLARVSGDLSHRE